MAEPIGARTDDILDLLRIPENFVAARIELVFALVDLRSFAEDLATVLQLAVWRLEQAREFSAQAIENIFNDLARKFELKLRDMTRPFYVAITGSEASTPLFQSIEILGSDLVRMRLRRALEALGGISSKKLKEMEKLYESFYGPLA